MQDDITLNDGRAMPRLGLGTYQIPDAHVAQVVRAGLDLGYRLIDTAAIYHNERGVGEGVDETAFVTTKLWNDAQGHPAAALDASLALLGLEAVDLYLIHWPRPDDGRFVSAWETLVRLREEGKARSIGVSNFLPEHIDAIVAATGVVPAVNQIELHPGFQQRAAQAYHADKGIVTQSWSPLGQGRTLRDERIGRIAGRLGTSAAQVIIAWHLAKGLAVIPKAGDLDHLADNWAARDVELTDEDVATIDAMDDADGRIGPDPLRF